MNREIKFRALKFGSDQWVYGSLCLNYENEPESTYIIDKDCTYIRVQSETVGQFTGYRDVDDIEIFEGDTLGDWNVCDGKNVQSREPVYFDEALGCWMLDHSANKDQTYSSSLFDNLNDYLYKVVGNVYNAKCSQLQLF